MEVYSNQPGVQLYTSNSLPEDPAKYKGDPKELKTLTGKNGNYYKHGALCLETQNYPDAINHVSICNFYCRVTVNDVYCSKISRKQYCIQVKFTTTL